MAFFFQEEVCSICNKGFIGEDIKYTYLECLHPICGTCYRSKYAFYEYCNECNIYVPTDVLPKEHNGLDDTYYFKPYKAIKMVLPMSNPRIKHDRRCKIPRNS